MFLKDELGSSHGRCDSPQISPVIWDREISSNRKEGFQDNLLANDVKILSIATDTILLYNLNVIQ